MVTMFENITAESTENQTLVGETELVATRRLASQTQTETGKLNLGYGGTI